MVTVFDIKNFKCNFVDILAIKMLVWIRILIQWIRIRNTDAQ
jgi:hypothetical protein